MSRGQRLQPQSGSGRLPGWVAGGTGRTAFQQPPALVPRAEGVRDVQDQGAFGGVAPAAQSFREIDQAQPQVIVDAGDRELAAVGQCPPQRLVLGRPLAIT
jgi:hypothetical protein